MTLANKALGTHGLLSEEARADLGEKFQDDVPPNEHKRDLGDSERWAEMQRH